MGLSLPPDLVIAELAAAASLAGIDVDDDDCRIWLRQVAEITARSGSVVRASGGGVSGHELALLDFDPSATENLRRIGRMVAMPKHDGIESALAIAGSAAQSRIQPFPADADFFERVNIEASTRAEATTHLALLIRSNAQEVDAHPALRLTETLLGVIHGVQLRWSPDELRQGWCERALASGQSSRIEWNAAAENPGFVKLDWMLLDPLLGGPKHVSKVIDATWQSPTGEIQSLDGLIDSDYQQIYLDARGAELAAFLTAGLNVESRDRYLWLMEREIAKHAKTGAVDHVKVAKRLYNYCRLAGRFREALFIRELFDEPAARLHAVRARLELAYEMTAEELVSLAGEVSRLTEALGERSSGHEVQAILNWARRPDPRTVETLRRELATLEKRIGVAADEAFAVGLQAYAPVATLLADILERHRDERA